jgi:thioredoxin reductase
MYVEQGCFVHLAAAVKSVATVPVIAVGRIKDPGLAERIIAEGRADMVAMGRSLLADPDLPRKALEGRTDGIRPCIGCCLGCIHAVLQLEPGGCVVNPDVGREYQLTEPNQTSTPKKVLVIGAGPGGLAAARMAALCGHHAVVFDRRTTPGGILHAAAKAPGRNDLQEIIDFYVRELARLEIPLYLGKDLDEHEFNAIAPQAVILASGSLPKIPLVKGLFQSPMDLWTAVDVLDGLAQVKEKVIVLGGGQAGLVTADFLAEQGKSVAVLNRRSHFAEEMSANDRYYLRERLKRSSVILFKDVVIEKFTADGAQFRHAKGQAHLSGYQSVVIAETGQPVREAINFLKKSGLPLYVIGDAKSARHLMFAVSEGEEAALTV